MQDFEGKVAIVTGGASGIGRAMAVRFAQQGMKLVLVDIDADPLEEAAEAIRAQGVEVLAQRVDVGDAAAMDGLGEAVFERFGAAHVVCNNAGVASGGPMWELSTADWEFTLRPNLWGVIHGVRVFGKHLVAQNDGHFVNTASMAGLVSAPGCGPYNVSKHGVVTLSETLAGDLQALGSKVGVSVLCPGFVSTRLWDAERNRPDAAPRTEEQEQGQALMRAVIEAGLPAEQVAQLVFEAICDERFYIFTHEGTKAAVESRMQSILDGQHAAIPAEGAAVFMK
ncbi:MAG: SDR family NAD(P)-dependent oxidoreductase [bacterium]|nr:SDR family NAD(P)-dependent oxidoreductase [bacterium]